MTFNTMTSLGRHGEDQIKKINDDDMQTKDKFKKYMNAMQCAEEFDNEDIMTGLYLFLQHQAEKLN